MIKREQDMASFHTLDERGYTVVTGAMSADRADAIRREIVALQRSADGETDRNRAAVLCGHQFQTRHDNRHQQGDAP